MAKAQPNHTHAYTNKQTNKTLTASSDATIQHIHSYTQNTPSLLRRWAAGVRVARFHLHDLLPYVVLCRHVVWEEEEDRDRYDCKDGCDRPCCIAAAIVPPNPTNPLPHKQTTTPTPNRYNYHGPRLTPLPLLAPAALHVIPHRTTAADLRSQLLALARPRLQQLLLRRRRRFRRLLGDSDDEEEGEGDGEGWEAVAAGWGLMVERGGDVDILGVRKLVICWVVDGRTH